MTRPSALRSPHLGRTVKVSVEVPAWTFTKRRADGTVDFVSPLPCPWAYGSLPGEAGGDGDDLDALVLDQTGPTGATLASTVQGVVHFVDAGRTDDKLVCAIQSVNRRQRVAIRAFFQLYAVAKRALNLTRGRTGVTRVLRVEWR
jgi:inorganic pyrophosphatase